MPIKASAAAEIRQLVDALGSGDDVRREAAIARLAIVGPRAVDRLVAAYRDSTDPDARIAILRALEPMADPRTVAVARQALARGGDEAIAGTAALRALLDSPHEASATQSLDALMTAALDEAADRRLRSAAFEALPRPVRDRLSEPAAAAPGDALWADAIEGKLPDDPLLLRDAVAARAAAAPPTALQTLIEAIRVREGAVRSAARRDAWRSVRGAIHQALALRGNRLAIYDLRETLERTEGPLPAGFLAALHAAGDASCLPALAAAGARTADEAWRAQLRDTFRAIAKRERITKRHAVMKKIAAKWPGFFAELG